MTLIIVIIVITYSKNEIYQYHNSTIGNDENYTIYDHDFIHNKNTNNNGNNGKRYIVLTVIIIMNQ